MSGKGNNPVQKSTMAAAELAHHFLDDLGCMVCQQIPIDLQECKSCNKILCKYCKHGIEAQGKNLQCPACKDQRFEFQEIQSKIVKSLLANMKVDHKCCPEQEEVVIFKYDDLK